MSALHYLPSSARAGMSKEQQADMIESINRSAMMNAFHAHHTGASSCTYLRSAPRALRRSHVLPVAHYINADIAAARVPHPANSFPDGDSTGVCCVCLLRRGVTWCRCAAGGMTKDEQQRAIEAINRRGVLSASVQHSSASSCRPMH